MNRRWVAILLLAVAVGGGPLAGCSSAAKSPVVGNVDGAIRTLADGGVAVMDDVNSTTPLVALTGTPSAMRFTRWQMRALVTEADAHSGYLGSELDGIAQPPPGAPPLSTLIGAWLTRKDGALAQYAAGLMGAPDYKHSAELVFPTIVVLTFIGDIARIGPTALHAPRFDFERLIASPANADGICSDVAGWVTSVVNNVTTAIQSNGTGWFSSLWNTVVTLVGTGVSIVINALAPLVAFITNIATVCGTLMQVASMFKPWTVQLTANPTSMTLTDVPGQGQFVATLHAEDVPWPSTLVDCVHSLAPDVKLDNASYTDAPVSWNAAATTPGLAVKTSEDDTLLKDKTAAYHFQTKTGEVVASCPRLFPAGKVAVTVTVARSDVTRVLNSLAVLVTNQLPAAARAYLADYIRAALNDATSAAQKFGAPQGSSIIAVSEQVPDPLCVQTPPPNEPSPVPTTHVIGHGVLPSGTCESVFTAADTAPLNGGVVFIPVDEHGNKVDIGAIMGSFTKGTFLNGPNGQQLAKLPAMPHGTDYDTSESSWCAVGTPPAKVVALVTVIPKGTLPYRPLPDLAANNAQYPRACRTAIGIDLLEYYNADCRDGAGSPATVTLYGPTVEYILTAADPSLSASAINAVLRHIAERSRN